MTPKTRASALALLCLLVTRALTPRLKGVMQTVCIALEGLMNLRVLRVEIDVFCMIYSLFWIIKTILQFYSRDMLITLFLPNEKTRST